MLVTKQLFTLRYWGALKGVTHLAEKDGFPGMLCDFVSVGLR